MSVLFRLNDNLEDTNLPVQLRVSMLSNYGKPQEEFLLECIKEYRKSEMYKLMKTGRDYFFNENAINKRKRYYIDRQGTPVETELLCNSKLSHPFMRKLVNQKVNYLLSKDFTIQGDSNYVELLNEYFNDSFKLTLTNIGSASVINGIAWVQVYYNENGELRFKHIPTKEIIPFWADNEHKHLDAIIRIYDNEEYSINSVEKKIWEYIEYYTKEGLWKYKRLKSGGNLIPLNASNLGEGHFRVLTSEGEQQAVWDKIPFVAFKYNRDEVSLIKWIKPLIDDYDINTSDNSNNLQDVPNSIKVIKGYEGNDKQEFSKNLSIFRNVFVGEGGDVTSLETPTNIAESDIHLQRLRKDIFEFGGGVDTVDKELRDVSGVALRFQYADLDMDCSEMAQQYKYSLRQLQWFINKDLQRKGIDFDAKNSNFLFNTAVILNESETINNLAISQNLISKKTLLENHPWVKNTQKELSQLEQDKKEQIEYETQTAEELAKINKKYKVTTSSNTTNKTNSKKS